MGKEFGNVKGFDSATCYLTHEQKADLLMLMAHKDIFFDECEKLLEDDSCFSRAAIALASIYHANNEAE